MGDYVNPTSIAGMYGMQQPSAPDILLPGHGALAGSLAAEASNTGNQFLNVNLESQAADLARKQYENREFASAPFAQSRQDIAVGKGKQELNQARLTGGQADQMDQMVQKLRAENNWDKVSSMAEIYPKLADPSLSPLEKQAIIDQASNTHRQVYGSEPDPGLSVYKGPQTEQAYKTAYDLSIWDRQRRQERAMTGVQTQSKEYLIQAEGKVQEKLLQAKGAIEKDIEQMRITAQKDIHNAENQTKVVTLQRDALAAYNHWIQLGGDSAHPDSPQSKLAFSQLSGPSEMALAQFAPTILLDPVFKNLAAASAAGPRIKGLIEGAQGKPSAVPPSGGGPTGGGMPAPEGAPTSPEQNSPQPGGEVGTQGNPHPPMPDGKPDARKIKAGQFYQERINGKIYTFQRSQ